MTKLNKSNIDKVIEAISDENKYFNMSCHSTDSYHTNLDSYETIKLESFYSPYENMCHTASCICGWANQIRLTEDNSLKLSTQLDDPRNAAAWLGLNDRSEADKLFYDIDGFSDLKDSPRELAIAVLENLKETGKVDWNVPFKSKSKFIINHE